MDGVIPNDRVTIIYYNTNAQVAVKSTSGISRRIPIRNIIMQGTVWANLCCTVLMDKLGKLMYNKPELMYKYRGAISVPSLQMVDDIMVLGKYSSLQTLQSNSVVNSFMNIKKLTLSETKCHTVHIGRRTSKECSGLKIENTQMNQETTVKYLGDKVNITGSIKATVEERRGKAFGITADILSIANSVPLGQWRVKSGVMLRQAMLVLFCIRNIIRL